MGRTSWRASGRSRERFVRDFGGGTWLNAAAATFVSAPGLKSPMGYDIAAFATREAAQQVMANRSGTNQETWAALIDGLKERG